MGWADRAACAGTPAEWWFGKANAPDRRKALACCQTCPVRAECGEFAEQFKPDDPHLLSGVFGGVDLAAEHRERKYEASRLRQEARS